MSQEGVPQEGVPQTTIPQRLPYLEERRYRVRHSHIRWLPPTPLTRQWVLDNLSRLCLPFIITGCQLGLACPFDNHYKPVCNQRAASFEAADKNDVLSSPATRLSGLPAAQQRRALEPSFRRKCGVGTNIAETSLTMPGTKYIVDSMLSK